jgi:hypothetical protein
MLAMIPAKFIARKRGAVVAMGQCIVPDATRRTRKDGSTVTGRKIGAGEGIRTLDPDLGKVVLYP